MMWAILYVVFGGVLVVHCSRAAAREFHTGRAIGFGNSAYDRNQNPVAFWLIVTGNFLAVVLGLAFLILGYLTYSGRLS